MHLKEREKDHLESAHIGLAHCLCYEEAYRDGMNDMKEAILRIGSARRLMSTRNGRVKMKHDPQMTVKKLIERLQTMNPDLPVSVMTEVESPRFQVEHWVTDVAGSSKHVIIIGNEWKTGT